MRRLASAAFYAELNGGKRKKKREREKKTPDLASVRRTSSQNIVDMSLPFMTFQSKRLLAFAFKWTAKLSLIRLRYKRDLQIEKRHEDTVIIKKAVYQFDNF